MAGLARVLSKLGYCSRSQARRLISAGQVEVDGAICRNPETPVDPKRQRLHVKGEPVRPPERLYVMLNKPRGLVTSRSDEHARPTVYRCFEGSDLPWLPAVGRLDKASEGLLLFSNDTAWSESLVAPSRHLDKAYHVQISGIPHPDLCDRLATGLRVSDGSLLSVKRASLLRTGTRNAWLEIVLDEGKNRQIRRLIEAAGLQVLRLIRVAIGPLQLGSLPKGQFRHLSPSEVRALAMQPGPA